jgi:uncharacterized protein (TIGR02996 family)
MPFLRAINSGVPDEVAHLVYADWLEENGHGERAELLRELTTYSFRKGELPEKKRDANRAAIKAMLPNASHPWLCQLFGTSAKATELSRQFEASDA